MVSRLAEQKGIDILLDVMEEIARLDLQLIILGTGASNYQEALASFHGRSGKIGVKIGFDNILAHRIEAGADMFLMSSKYEPCGLNQIYSLKYGTIPIVRATLFRPCPLPCGCIMRLAPALDPSRWYRLVR